jgi:hypothetical protein
VIELVFEHFSSPFGDVNHLCLSYFPSASSLADTPEPDSFHRGVNVMAESGGSLENATL